MDAWQPSGFEPGVIVTSSRGSRYRILEQRWSRERWNPRSPREAAFAAECVAEPSRRVLLRVGAPNSASRFGTFVAMVWPQDAQESDAGMSFGWRSDCACVATSSAGHPVIAAVLDVGELTATEVAVQDGPSPYRSQRVARSRLPTPMPFAALPWVEGATLRTLLRGALAQAGRPLGAGAALASTGGWTPGTCS